MDITVRDALTVMHGMFFGALLLLAFSGAAMGLSALSVPTGSLSPLTASRARKLAFYFAVMAALAWAAAFVGAYVIYPWYRAVPPYGASDLSAYPQRLLLSSRSTQRWHQIGMEWKEHIAWFAPMSLTAGAFVLRRYGAYLHALKSIRRALIGLLVLAFFSASVAGLFGAMLNKFAPVRGGRVIVLMRGSPHE